MISYTTIRYTKYLYDFASLFYVFPYKLVAQNDGTYLYVPIKRRWIPQFISVATLFGQCCTLIILSNFIYFSSKLITSDKIFILGVISIILVLLGPQCFVLFKPREFFELMNNYTFNYAKKNAKNYGEKYPCKRDGIEWLIVPAYFVVMMFSITLGPILIGAYFVKNPLSRLIRLIWDMIAYYGHGLDSYDDMNSETVGPYLMTFYNCNSIFTMIVISALNIHGALHLAVFVQNGLTFLNSQGKCLQLFKTKSSLAHNESDGSMNNFNQRIQNDYNKILVFSNAVLHEFRYLIAFNHYACILAMIAQTYILIAFELNTSAQILILSLDTIMAFTLGTEIKMFVELRTFSADLIEKIKVRLRKKSYERKYWFGAQPIKVKVGDWFTCETKTLLLEVFGRIIIESVVDLLLSIETSYNL